MIIPKTKFETLMKKITKKYKFLQEKIRKIEELEEKIKDIEDKQDEKSICQFWQRL